MVRKSIVFLLIHICFVFLSYSDIYERINVFGQFYTSKFQSKNVVIITEKDIELLKSHSVSEILGNFTAVNISRKGGSGENFDITMRGGNFEQILILINGVPYNNSQTGHFNSDFPFQVQDIKRIEVIKGGSSTAYGSGAYSGVINIVLNNNPNIGVSFEGGEKNYYSTRADIGKSFGKFKVKFGVNKKKSDGFYDGREFDILTLSGSASYLTKLTEVKAFAGYKKNNFGAKGFYAPYSSLENIGSLFSQFNIKRQIGKSFYCLRYSFATHKDDFILDRYNIALFKNESFTYTHRLSLSGNFNIKRMRLSAGFDLKKDIMDSSSMGYHIMNTGSVFFNMNIPFDRSGMDIGVRATIFSGVAPSTIFYSGFYYNFNDNFRFKVNMGKSYRLPSFTELYYNSPANHGNSNLLSETNYNYETSLVYLFGKHSLELNVFYRNQSNSIDWVKFMDGKGETTRYWEAVNIKKNDNAGFEFLHNIVFDNILFNYGIEKIFSIDYYKNLLSKYGLRYPDFIIKFNVSYPIIDKLRIIANYNYKTINDTDIKGHYLNLKLNLTVNKIKIALKINNVFNTAIEEIPGVKIPGRWAYIQISYNL